MKKISTDGWPCIDLSLGPAACVYVSLSFFLASPCDGACMYSTWGHFQRARFRENLWMETSSRLTVRPEKASDKIKKKRFSGRIRNLFYNWQICSPLSPCEIFGAREVLLIGTIVLSVKLINYGIAKRKVSSRFECVLPRGPAEAADRRRLFMEVRNYPY